MSVALNTDYDLEPDCDECALGDDCYDRSCLTRIYVGPCSAYNRTTGEMDMDQMCIAPTATGHTPTFTFPFIERNRRNRCSVTRFPTNTDCSIALDFDICHSESTMKFLMAKCHIALMFVPRVDLFDVAAPQANQGIALIRGIFLGSDLPWNNEFSDIQSTSRTFNSSGGCRGLQGWLDSLPDPVTVTSMPVAATTERNRVPFQPVKATA